MKRTHRRTGNPKGRLPRDPILRLAEHILGWPECGKHWLWTGARGREGQPVFRLGGRTAPKLSVRVYIFEIVYGPVPEGREVVVRCNQDCVHPDHLQLVDQLYYERAAMMKSATRLKLTHLRPTEKPDMSVGTLTPEDCKGVAALLLSPDCQRLGAAITMFKNTKSATGAACAPYFNLTVDVDRLTAIRPTALTGLKGPKSKPLATGLKGPKSKPLATKPRNPNLTEEEEKRLAELEDGWYDGDPELLHLRAKANGEEGTI